MRMARLATWLLRRFPGGAHRESLIGDLDEQLSRGRSSVWYWRQVLSAILIAVASDLRDHKVRTVGSAILSLAIVVAWVEATLALYLWLSETWVNARVPNSGLLFLLWHPFGGGLCLIWCLGSAASGWLTARAHRPAMVVAGALAQVPYTVWWTSVWFHPQRIADSPARLWLPVYVSAIIVVVGMPVATMLAGLSRAGDAPVQPPIR